MPHIHHHHVTPVYGGDFLHIDMINIFLMYYVLLFYMQDLLFNLKKPYIGTIQHVYNAHRSISALFR